MLRTGAQQRRSHFGSICASGNIASAFSSEKGFASIGWIGGITGRSTLRTLVPTRGQPYE